MSIFTEPCSDLARQRYDDETQEVARVARQYQRSTAGLSWGEAIRLAEKHVAGFEQDRSDA